MRKVRMMINVALGSMVAALTLSACHKKEEVTIYATDYGIPYIDTTAHCMYGVDPNPQIIKWDDQEQNTNE